MAVARGGGLKEAPKDNQNAQFGPDHLEIMTHHQDIAQTGLLTLDGGAAIPTAAAHWPVAGHPSPRPKIWNQTSPSVCNPERHSTSIAETLSNGVFV